jgi:peptidoglycan/LPS O-acetylase OafA/YrhL
MPSPKGRIAYRIGAAVALAASFIQVWMNLAVGIVGNEDNPVNQGFYGVVATAAACAFVAQFRAEGMARAMLAVAAVQALLAIAVATAPSTARDEPMGAIGVLVLSGGFTALWLLSAALFHASVRQERRGTVR